MSAVVDKFAFICSYGWVLYLILIIVVVYEVYFKTDKRLSALEKSIKKLEDHLGIKDKEL